MTDIICFHNPDEENGYLSNWYPSRFVVDDVEFSSMEQYMMYRKACCFNDAETAARILRTSDVAEIKRLGRLVAGYDDHVWNGVRQIEVYEGLLAKFSQERRTRCATRSDRQCDIGGMRRQRPHLGHRLVNA